jgi:Domain of unknown function (DUF4158)
MKFELSPRELETVNAVHTFSVSAHLILQIGYFKARRQFFTYTREVVLNDPEYIHQRYFPKRELAEIRALSKPTRLEQQQIILTLFGYSFCSMAEKEALEQKAQRIAMLSTQPVFILREALQYLSQQRIVVPGYSYLQDMAGRVVSGEHRRITDLPGKMLTPDVEKRPEALLQADEGIYRISVLKHQPKDFSYGELRHEVAQRKLLQPLYEFGQMFLSPAGLSNESVKYYSSLVQF